MGVATATERAGFLSRVMSAAHELATEEWMKVFLAFLSAGAGICSIAFAVEGADYYVSLWITWPVGLVLLAGSATFFWTRRRPFDRDSDVR